MAQVVDPRRVQDDRRASVQKREMIRPPYAHPSLVDEKQVEMGCVTASAKTLMNEVNPRQKKPDSDWSGLLASKRPLMVEVPQAAKRGGHASYAVWTSAAQGLALGRYDGIRDDRACVFSLKFDPIVSINCEDDNSS
jgi:hypothetical protein